METDKIKQALLGTINPTETAQATAYLDSVQKIIGFPPAMLQIIMDENLEPPIRQAAAIYLKNMVQKYWDSVDEADLAFTIHEQDRHTIRESIVEAIIHSPDALRNQLSAMLNTIFKYDFPGRWPGAVGKISQYLDANDGSSWMGALIVMYRLVKVYEYKKAKERIPLTEAMKVLLPMLYERMTALMPDQSQEAVYLQKMILKIMFALVQFSLNFEMISMEQFGEWMKLVKEVVDRDVPSETLQVDEDDRPELIWWKCKKWAMHMMARIFERYGSPGQVQAEYNKFADFYLKHHAAASIETALKVLDRKRIGEYVSPRVLNQALCYLQSGQVVKEVIFPLLCHSDEDEQLWEEDPTEYIKIKYDIFEDLISPSASAGSFLSASMKRRGELTKTLEFVSQAMQSSQATARHLDGILHMVGILAPNLLKKKVYKRELEKMLVTHVLPHIVNEQTDKFLKARALWVVQTLSEAPFSREQNLKVVVEGVTSALLTSTELPIKVEAAIAMQMLLADKAQAENLFRPHIVNILPVLMNLLKETENDDLTTVMDRVLNTYTTEIIPIAVNCANELANIFKNILNAEGGIEERSVAAMGILGSLESIITVMEDQKEIMLNLEGIVLDVIRVVFQGQVIDFYEEILSLVESLTTTGVSAPMWEVYQAIYNMYKLEGSEFFIDMMPSLHNYLCVDTDAFLSQPNRLEMMVEMCKGVLESDELGEDVECHAGKLLECVILQCKGKIDGAVPTILTIALARLSKEVGTSELRTMLLQIVIAGFYYNATMMLQTLASVPPIQNAEDGTVKQVLEHFINQWISDTDCFLGIHDRKLSVIGLCQMVSLSAEMRPNVLAELQPKLFPSIIILFDGLEKAYKAQAELANAETDSEDESDEEGGPANADDGLASDEDEIDDTTLDYLERLSKKEIGPENDSGNGDAYSESWSDDNDWDEQELEMYDTPLDREDDSGYVDEYNLFRDTLQLLSQHQAEWYTALMNTLNDEQKKELEKIFVLADQKKAAKQSKSIEEKGGYDFSRNDSVPSTFNFGP